MYKFTKFTRSGHIFPQFHHFFLLITLITNKQTNKQTKKNLTDQPIQKVKFTLRLFRHKIFAKIKYFTRKIFY